MARTKSVKTSESSTKKMRPALTPEGREQQLCSRAIDLAEKQLIEGTASSQVITHFLKLASTRNELEKEKLRKENELLKAKTESLQSMERIEELYSNAMQAMMSYGGQRSSSDD